VSYNHVSVVSYRWETNLNFKKFLFNLSGTKGSLRLQGSKLKNVGLQGSKLKNVGLQGSKLKNVGLQGFKTEKLGP